MTPLSAGYRSIERMECETFCSTTCIHFILLSSQPTKERYFYRHRRDPEMQTNLSCPRSVVPFGDMCCGGDALALFPRHVERASKWSGGERREDDRLLSRLPAFLSNAAQIAILFGEGNDCGGRIIGERWKDDIWVDNFCPHVMYSSFTPTLNSCLFHWISRAP